MSAPTRDLQGEMRAAESLLAARDFARAQVAYARIAAAADGETRAQALVGVSRAAFGAGDRTGAEAAITEAHGAAPHSAEIIVAYADFLQHTGALARAREIVDQGLEQAPTHERLLRKLIDVLQAAGDLGGAIKTGRRLAKVRPNDPTPRVKIGQLWLQRVERGRATEEFVAALKIDPDNLAAMDGLSAIWRIDGPADQARAILEHRASLTPDAPGRATSLLKAALAQPVVARSVAEITAARARLEQYLKAPPAARIEDPQEAGLGPCFYLAYQGLNDRPIQEALARTYTAMTPSLAGTAAHIGRKPRRRIKVGLVSNFFGKHTVGYLTYGLVRALDRERFEPVLLRTPYSTDDAHADRFRELAPVVDLPANLNAARALIAKEEFDIIHYPEIGMDHFSYFLAFARLATLQTVAWGHPVTTGIPAIDLFLSVDAMEPPNAAAHYSETLVRLNDLSFAAEAPAPVDADAGLLDATRPSYVCPQSLYKVHPEFDPVIAALLRADTDGIVYFIGYSKDADGILKERLAAAGADLARVKLLPRMTARQFLTLLRSADVILDVPHWSGGKTSLEALAAGTPIVHWPGAFMRGRHTLAFYRRMGVDAAIVGSAEDYVRTAARLVHEKAFRAEVRGAIAAAGSRLFGDVAAIREIEDVWAAALAAKTG